MNPSWFKAVTPSANPISSTIFSGLESNVTYTGKSHFPARGVGKSTRDEIMKRGPGVGAFAHPTDYDHVTLSDKIGLFSTPTSGNASRSSAMNVLSDTGRPAAYTVNG